MSHELRPSCGPYGTRCGVDHGPVTLCDDCREAVATWCVCPVRPTNEEDPTVMHEGVYL